ncbi:YicC/YloC family endoribonuclease [Tepidamorphus sp. 3E244]|uniref:YicC/YloC family endoribonuclease n=1 Tax=Tepidamorphus sp. 3E244 TaxID=3385498 RepID=UPI0038FC9079
MSTSVGNLASMTGFAAVSGSGADHDWEWTLRSVNGKGLDLRFRLPAGFERIEPALRTLAGKAFARGSMTVSVTIRKQGGDEQGLVVNRAALDTVQQLAQELARQTGATPATVDGYLSVRGIFETENAGADTPDAGLYKTLENGFPAALDALATARASEGAAIGAVLAEQMDTVADLTAQADALPARRPEAVAARLKGLVSDLLNASPQLDPERLHQEAVLMAAKADIREELDRLNAHVEAARVLLAKGGPVGRDLNFLAQEFNREANTLCSKSSDTELTRIGLKLKSVIDQFREQVQNIE